MIPVLSELRGVLDRDQRTYEVILVNDGSSDDTLNQLKGFSSTWPPARIINLLQNAGQGAALFAGIKKTLGRNVILLDGDGETGSQGVPDAVRILAFAGIAVVGVEDGGVAGKLAGQREREE